MITEIIDEIVEAERRAQQIMEDAQAEVDAISADILTAKEKLEADNDSRIVEMKSVVEQEALSRAKEVEAASVQQTQKEVQALTENARKKLSVAVDKVVAAIVK